MTSNPISYSASIKASLVLGLLFLMYSNAELSAQKILSKGLNNINVEKLNTNTLKNQLPAKLKDVGNSINKEMPNENTQNNIIEGTS